MDAINPNFNAVTKNIGDLFMRENVIQLRGAKSSNQQLKAKPLNWVSKLLNDYKKRQDELRQKKIDYLIEKTYEYFLTILINKIAETGELDFHPSLYKAGIVINEKAASLAKEAVINNAVKFGSKRIDKCYKACREQFGEPIKRVKKG